MMTGTLRIILTIAIVCYFILVFTLLKRKKLALKYSLLWLALGIMMLLLVAFPVLLTNVSNLLGFASEMNALFASILAFAFVLIMALTSIVSKQTEKIRQLIQTSALLEKRIRELEGEGQEANHE